MILKLQGRTHVRAARYSAVTLSREPCAPTIFVRTTQLNIRKALMDPNRDLRRHAFFRISRTEICAHLSFYTRYLVVKLFARSMHSRFLFARYFKTQSHIRSKGVLRTHPIIEFGMMSLRYMVRYCVKLLSGFTSVCAYKKPEVTPFGRNSVQIWVQSYTP